MSKTLIVGEDSQTISHAIELLAAFEGFSVMTVKNMQALFEAAKQKPYMLMLDYALPGFPLVDAIKQLRASAGLENVPIIILTSAKATVNEASLKQAGVTAFLQKPFLSEELKSVFKLPSVQATEPKAVELPVEHHMADLPAEHRVEMPAQITASPVFSQPAHHPIEGLSREALEAIARQSIEKIVWEVVPKLAETLIKEEIRRLMHKNT